jgi:hypothetical protein
VAGWDFFVCKVEKCRKLLRVYKWVSFQLPTRERKDRYRNGFRNVLQKDVPCKKNSFYLKFKKLWRIVAWCLSGFNFKVTWVTVSIGY